MLSAMPLPVVARLVSEAMIMAATAEKKLKYSQNQSGCGVSFHQLVSFLLDR